MPGTFQQAFHLMRSGRPGPVLIDLPIDVQMTEIEFDVETYAPLPVYKPAATRAQVEKALDMLAAAERPLIVSGGGVINADAADLLVEFAELTGVPVVPTLMGWGTIPDDHELNAGMVGLQTSHRYGNATMLGRRLRARHRQPLGQPAHRRRRDLHARAARSCTSTSSRPRSAGSSRPTSASSPTPRPPSSCSSRSPASARTPARCPTARRGRQECQERKRTMWRKTNFDDVPIKPQRVYQEMNRAFGKDARYVSHHRPLPDPGRPAAARLRAAALDQRRPGRPAGLDRAGRARRRHRRPGRAPSSRCRATTTSSS